MTTMADQGAFVRAKRQQGAGWNSIAMMLGKPVDTVRREHDRGYMQAHVSAGPVCKKLTKSRMISVVAERYELKADDAALLVELWVARGPLGVNELYARANVRTADDAAMRVHGKGFRHAVERVGLAVEMLPAVGYCISEPAAWVLDAISKGEAS